MGTPVAEAYLSVCLSEAPKDVACSHLSGCRRHMLTHMLLSEASCKQVVPRTPFPSSLAAPLCPCAQHGLIHNCLM